MTLRSLLAIVSVPALAALGACARPEADLLLVNGRVYALAWSDPAPDGTPAADAPFDSARWHPDASAVAIRGDRIVFVGSDAANRETLDFFDSVFAARPAMRALRHRIEHAQVLHPGDIPRFARSDIVASMQPPHATEDKGWAADRLGAERVRGAYAWRSLRRALARVVFSSDLPGTDFDIFYGLHSAITRRDPSLEPAGGWYPEQRMTPEEAVRGYTTWAAWAGFLEERTGVLARGRWADLTVMDVDPFVLGPTAPERLLGGRILLTVVGGRVVFERAGGD